MDSGKLIWSIDWYAKGSDEPAGELDLEFSVVDPERLISALGLPRGTPLNGGFPIKTSAGAEYLGKVCGNPLDLERYDYFIEILRVPKDG